MTKKEIGNTVWNKAKQVASLAVGAGTAVVVETIAMTVMPSELTPLMEGLYKAGTHGTALVTSTVAAELTYSEITTNEQRIRKAVSLLTSKEESTEEVNA